MSKQIPWARVLVEGVVIVGSILLAFVLQAWWEGRQEEVRAADYMAALLEEVSANREELNATTRSTEEFMAASRAVRRLFVSGWSEVPSDSVGYLLVRAGAVNVIDPVTNTHDQLVATGDLRLLPVSVRDALSVWKRALRNVTEYWDPYMLNHRTTSGDPFYVDATAFGELVISYDPETYADDPVRFENDIQRLAEDRKLDNLLMYQLLLGNARLEAYRRLRGALAELDDVLRRNLNVEPSDP